VCGVVLLLAPLFPMVALTLAQIAVLPEPLLYSMDKTAHPSLEEI
jgi:hypothetical protein